MKTAAQRREEDARNSNDVARMLDEVHRELDGYDDYMYLDTCGYRDHDIETVRELLAENGYGIEMCDDEDQLKVSY